MLFYRDYRGFTGGHLKVRDYFEHLRASESFEPKVYLTPGSRPDHLWPAESLVAEYDPDSADVLFIAGLDWMALSAWPGIENRKPVVNLIQHVRHGRSMKSFQATRLALGIRPRLRRRSSLGTMDFMSSLKQTMQSDLTTAMRAGDADTVRTLRMVLTSITQAEVSGTQAHELSEADEVALLSTELKRRKESAEAFRAAGRDELADAEDAEAVVIQRYLPQPLSDAELDEMIAAAVANAEATGATGGRAMGAVMKELKPGTAGRVDGAELAARVKAALGM